MNLGVFLNCRKIIDRVAGGNLPRGMISSIYGTLNSRSRLLISEDSKPTTVTPLLQRESTKRTRLMILQANQRTQARTR